MAKDAYEIQRLLKEGISLEVSANDFDEYELGRMVESAVEGNAALSIKDSNELDEFKIKRIARNGKRNVVFR